MDRVPQSQAGLGIWSPIESINHATVVFYGAKNCHYKLTGHTLPLSVLETQIIQPYTAFLEQVRQRREAKRQARLAAYGRREEPAAGQVERYVQAVYDNLLTELAQTESGLGLRHQRLYAAALTVGGLESAPWLTAAARGQLGRAVDDLLEAAEANGYVATYGEDDALRTIENGLARGGLLPLAEPVWYGERPFFQVGDRVRAVVGGQVKAVGRVTRLREMRHWEYELDTMTNVWFARSLLEPDRSEH